MEKSYELIQKSYVKLKEVTKSDYRFLYDLLKERDPQVNISHKKMPTYENHIKFVRSKPYSKWYIIFSNNRKSGSVYLTRQDEIGIFIKKDLWAKGLGMKALQLMMKKNPRTRYLANISPKNKKSIEFFKKNGFNLIQYTYELIPSKELI